MHELCIWLQAGGMSGVTRAAAHLVWGLCFPDSAPPVQSRHVATAPEWNRQYGEKQDNRRCACVLLQELS